MKSLGVLISVLTLVFASSASADISPTQAAAGFTGSYNCDGKWKTPDCAPTIYRVHKMRCWNSPSRGYFDCFVQIIRRSGGSKPLCGAIVIDTGFDVLTNDHAFACGLWSKLVHKAAKF